MKAMRAWRMALVWIGLFVLAAPVSAAAFWTVTIDSQPIPAELPPVEVGNGVLLVAARSLCQQLGADYTFDEQSGVITIASPIAHLDLREGDAHARVNGRIMDMPVAPRKVSGTVMVPAPWVPRALGFQAAWDSAGHILSLTSTSVAEAPAMARAQAQRQEQAPAANAAPAPSAAAAAGGSGQAMPHALPPPEIGPPPMIAGKSGLTAPGSPISMGMLGMPSSAPPSSATPPMEAGMPPSMPPSNAPAVSPYDQAQSAMAQAHPPPGAPGMMATAGKMDNMDNRTVSGRSGPDPAVTGLVIERHYDTLSNSYLVRYRVTNVGDRPAEHEMLVRLLVGDGSDMQIVQDIKVDRLDVGQSLDFEWSGTATQYPLLQSMKVYAEAKIMVNQGVADVNSHNNSRRVKITY